MVYWCAEIIVSTILHVSAKIHAFFLAYHYLGLFIARRGLQREHTILLEWSVDGGRAACSAGGNLQVTSG